MKISIISVCYNSDKTIADTLRSARAQTYANIEHIIVDGGSKDSTLAVVAAEVMPNHQLVSEKDNGIYDALNKGLALATGDVVGFLHSDDLFAHPDVLARIAAVFVADPSACAVYGDLDYVRKDDTAHVVRRWAGKPFSPGRLAWGWMPPHPALYVRREWYARINGFDTRYRIAGDYFSILQLFSRSDFQAVHLPEVLVKMRLGGASNRSLRALLRKIQEDWDALQRTGCGALGGAGALVWKNLSKLGQFWY
jgi:glycosyltransferase